MTRTAIAIAVALVTVWTLARAYADDAPPPAPLVVLPPAPPPASPEPPPPAADALTFAGSIQLDYLAVPTDAHARATTLDGATAEVSLKLTKDFGKHASATVKACFACHGFELGMGYVELRAREELRVRVGRFTPSFGSFPLRHDPANHSTSDKPLPYDMGRMLRRDDWDEGILPAPWVDNGLELGGTHFFTGGQLDYAAYAISGPKGGPDAADFDFTLSRSPAQYYVDNNSEPAVGARVATTLELGDEVVLALGASAMAGHYDPARALAFAIAGADLVARLPGVAIRAEYLIRRTEMALGADPATRFKYGPDASGHYASYFVKDGFYVEAEVPIGPFAIVVRGDGLRRIGNVLATSALASSSSLYRGTVALGYRLTPKLQLKASVEAYRFHELADELAIHAGLAAPF